MKRLICLVLMVLGLMASVHALAQVRIDPGGVGGALIVPYWTAAGGNDSLITIRNDSDRPTVAKLHWLDSEGQRFMSYNLYLNARAVWAGAITVAGGSVPALINASNACLMTDDVGAVVPMPRGSQELAVIRGSIEIIQMATASEGFATANPSFWTSCEDIADFFNEGPWGQTPNAGLDQPSQTISASVNFINVAKGVMNTVAATALADFSDVAQHTSPSSEFPDLSSAVDSEMLEGQVRSLVCAPADCRVDLWPRAIDAVAAALTVTTISADFELLDSIDGVFEWMIHRPLKHYEARIDGFAIASAGTISHSYREGEYILDSQGCGVPPPFTPCFGPEFPIENGLVHNGLDLTGGRDGLLDTVPTSMLAHPSRVLPGFGLGRLEAILLRGIDSGTSRLRFLLGRIGNDGRVINGEPVIAFAIQQYSNGTLVDDQAQAVLANYRATAPVRRVLTVSDPE